MWKMIIGLWLLPLSFGVVMLARLAEGNPPVKVNESQLLLGEKEDVSWSPWLVIGLFALAVIFFGVGFFEGLVILNFGSSWLVSTPLMTAVAAIFLLALCLRLSSRKSRIEAHDSAPLLLRDDRSTDYLSR